MRIFMRTHRCVMHEDVPQMCQCVVESPLFGIHVPKLSVPLCARPLWDSQRRACMRPPIYDCNIMCLCHGTKCVCVMRPMHVYTRTPAMDKGHTHIYQFYKYTYKHIYINIYITSCGRTHTYICTFQASLHLHPLPLCCMVVDTCASPPLLSMPT